MMNKIMVWKCAEDANRKTSQMHLEQTMETVAQETDRGDVEPSREASGPLVITLEELVPPQTWKNCRERNGNHEVSLLLSMLRLIQGARDGNQVLTQALPPRFISQRG